MNPNHVCLFMNYYGEIILSLAQQEKIVRLQLFFFLLLTDLDSQNDVPREVRRAATSSDGINPFQSLPITIIHVGFMCQLI